jgi:quercetin dioxygenase-like cupin family protein
MRTLSVYFPTESEKGRRTIFPGVNIATSSGERLMIAVVDLAPNSVVELHSHPHEQCGMLLKGRAIFYIDDEQKTLKAGDVYFMPGNVPHKVVVLDEPTQAIDIFTPIRDEYR